MTGSNTIEHFFIADDGCVPNNAALPFVLYRMALPAVSDRTGACQRLFRDNGWGDDWVDGIYSFHHYHSTAHEVLGIVRGSARVILGGEQGRTLTLNAGDVVVIPAGGGHCNAGSSSDLQVVGAYPPGQSWDLRRGDPDEHAAALISIQAVALPVTDPVYGPAGPLMSLWRG